VPRQVALKFREHRALYYPKTAKLAYPFHKESEQLMPAALGVLEEVGGDDEDGEEANG
jgi:transcription-repair coupling factor (superfamily II helicase)